MCLEEDEKRKYMEANGLQEEDLTEQDRVDIAFNVGYAQERGASCIQE